jgi:hypothetical protein
MDRRFKNVLCGNPGNNGEREWGVQRQILMLVFFVLVKFVHMVPMFRRQHSQETNVGDLINPSKNLIRLYTWLPLFESQAKTKVIRFVLL